ncbi:MAG: lipid-A-disaccharide synthase [Acidobacteriota bacterium]|nr:MAG: lipid-A-disaccharide synthase [Acidobacteriota bacterium]
MKQAFKIMIVAGESSGDSHAARLVSALKGGFPETEFEFFGSAGKMMREAGVEAVVEAERMAIMGGLEIARELPMFIRAFRRLRYEASIRRPDAVILVDFPDFNLRLASSLKKRGFKIIYYISPQVWAWKRGRVKTMNRSVERLLSILPFEEDFYREQGFKRVTYVGNPIASEVKAKFGREEFFRKHGLDADSSLVALLPGSRKVELRYIAPELIAAARLMEAKEASVQFVVPLASSRSEEELRAALSRKGGEDGTLPTRLVFVRGETYEALAASDAAAVASGTATLEAAVLGTPMAVVYKLSKLNYRAISPFVSIDVFGLVNLIAGKMVARELIQDELKPEALAEELFALLNKNKNESVREELARVREKLGPGGASSRAAEEVMKVIRNS